MGKAKAIAGLGVLAAFAFPTLVRSMRERAANADNTTLCYSATGLCSVNRKFVNTIHALLAVRKTKEKGKENGVSRTVLIIEESYKEKLPLFVIKEESTLLIQMDGIEIMYPEGRRFIANR